MNQSGRTRKTKQGSVLVFSLLILSIMLVTALTVLSSALLNQKAALSTGSSTKSFQVADSGVEKVLYEIYKRDHGRIADLAIAIGGTPDPTCASGVISFSVAGERATVSFYKSDPSTPGATILFSSCDDATWRDQVVKIRVEGASGSTTRAVEVAVEALCTSTYAVGDEPYGITFDSSTNSIWVANFSSDSVTKLRASDGQLLGTYNTGDGPLGVAFDPSTNSVWVANRGSDNVTKLRASDGQLLGTYNAGNGPGGIVFDSSTDSIWTGNYFGNNVTKLRASDGQLIGTYGAGGSPSVVYMAVTFDSSTNSVWAATTVATKFRASDGQSLGTYAVGNGSSGIAFDSSTDSVWVTNRLDDDVTKLRASDGQLIGTYNVGQSPQQIVYNPSTASLWNVNTVSNSVTQLSASDGQLLGTYDNTTSVAALFGITLDTSTNFIWASGVSNDSVFKLSVACGS